jgi:hypothetical protein
MKMSRITPSRRSPAIVVAILTLVAALAGTAIAGPDATTSAITKATVKKIANKQANKLIDETTAFAKVDQNGNILAASGVSSATRTAPGDYLVVFERDITNCAEVAGIRQVHENLFPGVTTTGTTAANTVRVGTLNLQGQHVDGNGFNLIVTC